MKRYKRVNIEISNLCNLQCSFCPEVHRAKQVMDEPLFRRTIADVAPLTEEVCLHLMGEPLGHPELSKFVDICAEHAVPVNLTTNGTLLDDARQAILLRPIVRQVNISIHSFEANFGEADVTRYLSRVFDFTHRAFASRPDLYLNYRLWDLRDPAAFNTASATNQRIRDALREEFGFELDPDAINLRRRKSYRIQGRLYLNLDSKFEWPSLAAPFRSESGFCHGLSNHFGIHADGTVVPCCLDKEAVLNLGSLRTSSLTEILDGEKAMRIAAGFRARKCVEELCQRCDFIQRFDKKPDLRET